MGLVPQELPRREPLLLLLVVLLEWLIHKLGRYQKYRLACYQPQDMHVHQRRYLSLPLAARLWLHLELLIR
jgi:hypothetical protein